MLLGGSAGQYLYMSIERDTREVFEFVSSTVKSLLYATIAAHLVGPILFDTRGVK